MPIYEYRCNKCDFIFEKIEKVTKHHWDSSILMKVRCPKCGAHHAYKIPSSFKIGSKILETTGKSGYQTDKFTIGKLIDESGIPYEEKERLVKREKRIKEVNKYTKKLKRRGKHLNFDPFSVDE